MLSHDDAHYEDLVRVLFRATDFLYLGRGIHFPIALEGALKLKEISYIHAEGYPAGEMKHGPNALIDENLPVVVLATRDPDSEESRIRYEKTLSNIQEVKAREGIVIAVCCDQDEEEVRQTGRSRDSRSRDQRAAAAAPRNRAAAVAGVSHRGPPRLRCRSAAQPRQERHCGMRQCTPRICRFAHAAKVSTISPREVESVARNIRISTGLLTLFIQHTSASLTDSGECRSRRDRRPE